MSTPAQIEAAKARFQLVEGAKLLRAGQSRFGRAGLLVRAVALRATKPLGVREALMDERLLEALETLALDTSIGHRAASSFPHPLQPGAVTDVSTEVGELFMHADDRVMTPFVQHHGFWEPQEAELIRTVLRPGDTLVDVGANTGYFSVLGSKLLGPTGRVIAIEPEPRNIALLKANLWRNGCDNAIVLPIAAHRARGFLPLRCNEENRGDHRVGIAKDADLLVPCARLDELLAGIRVDFAKVDTQGTDHDVIDGMSGLIDAADTLTIMCEFWIDGMAERGVAPRAVAAEYGRLGFGLAVLGEGPPRSVSGSDLVAAAEADPGRYVNLVLRRPTGLRRPSRPAADADALVGQPRRQPDPRE